MNDNMDTPDKNYNKLYKQYINFIDKEEKSDIEHVIKNIFKILIDDTEPSDIEIIEKELERQENSEQAVHSLGMQRLALIVAFTTVLLIQTITLFDPVTKGVEWTVVFLFIVAVSGLVLASLMCIHSFSKNANTPRIGTEIIELAEIMQENTYLEDIRRILFKNRIDSLLELHMRNVVMYRRTKAIAILLPISIVAIIILNIYVYVI